MTLVSPGCTRWERVEDWLLSSEPDALILDAAFPADSFDP